MDGWMVGIILVDIKGDMIFFSMYMITALSSSSSSSSWRRAEEWKKGGSSALERKKSVCIDSDGWMDGQAGRQAGVSCFPSPSRMLRSIAIIDSPEMEKAHLLGNHSQSFSLSLSVSPSLKCRCK
jgi:hypothetical protein